MRTEEERKEKCREWQQKNKEYIKEKNRKKYQENKEYWSLRNKEYVKKNKEKLKEYRIEYYKSNWYYLNKYQKFQMTIPEARKMSHKCEACSEERLYTLQWHHKDFNRNNNKKENIQVLCANCHMETHFINSLNNKKKTYGK